MGLTAALTEISRIEKQLRKEDKSQLKTIEKATGKHTTIFFKKPCPFTDNKGKESLSDYLLKRHNIEIFLYMMLIFS